MRDGAIIRVRQHGNPRGPRLVLSHGNGLAIDGYLPFWNRLADDYDLVLFDLRNHGHNPRHDIAHHDVAHFVSDIGEVKAGVDVALGAKPAAGVFHSISAVAAIWDALDHGLRWDALALFDPPLVPTPGNGCHEVANAFDIDMSNWAATRLDRFSGPAALGTTLKNSYSLRRSVDGAHELMARSILRRDDATGEWVLRCPREGESRIYLTTEGLDLCSRLDELKGPVIFICADPDQDDALAPNKVNREMHAQFGHRYKMVADTSHLLQVENPGECARITQEFLAEFGLGSTNSA